MKATPPAIPTRCSRKSTPARPISITTTGWCAAIHYIDRKKANETDISKMIALGYRIGKLLPMLSWADYHYGLPHGYVTGSETIEAHRVTSLVLRYDLTTSSAVRLQYDQWKDRGDENYRTTLPYGDSKLIALSYDMTF